MGGGGIAGADLEEEPTDALAETIGGGPGGGLGPNAVADGGGTQCWGGALGPDGAVAASCDAWGTGSTPRDHN